MPIPVPIPPGPLFITESMNARAEEFIAALAQVMCAGTTGASIVTPPTTIPSGINSSVLTPLLLDSKEKQLFIRQLALVIAKGAIPSIGPATTTELGLVTISSAPLDPNNPNALNSEEVSVLPAGNKIPRADATGKIDPNWLSDVPILELDCPVEVVVGDLVYVAGSRVVDRVDITSFAKMPCIGCVSSKTSSTKCIVKMSGFIEGVYSGLTPQKMYFVGSDGRPAHPPPIPSLSPIFIQPIGVALDSTSLVLSPSMNLTKVIGVA